jgi:hypothetical protein
VRKLYGINSNPQFLNDVRLDFVQISWGRKGLTADPLHHVKVKNETRMSQSPGHPLIHGLQPNLCFP